MESDEEERIIYPPIETGTGSKNDIQSNTVPCLARTTGTRLEDILPDKVPRSDPCKINSHALTNQNEATGHTLTKGLAQVGQRIANRKAAWTKDLQGAIREALKTQCVKPETPELKFDMTKEAAEKNLCILTKYKKDLGIAIQAQH